MAFELIPRSFRDFASRMPSLWENEELLSVFNQSDLTIFTDPDHVTVEAPVPGLDPSKVEVTYDQGVLSIRGQADEETSDKKRNYYRKSSKTYSYRVSVPGGVDPEKDPEVSYKNGMIIATFSRTSQERQPKKLPIRQE